jgi:hypothetical protein
VIADRARIAEGFGLSAFDHWGRVKGAIRKTLFPRANELLQIAGVRRMLDEALARGVHVLVAGNTVFWYEPSGAPSRKSVSCSFESFGQPRGRLGRCLEAKLLSSLHAGLWWPGRVQAFHAA